MCAGSVDLVAMQNSVLPRGAAWPLVSFSVWKQI